ncbi:MAG: TetR/AcrR family transcriptional regulator [Rhodobacteraceae bacterium]|nr:TetR/AcrR family transcriptional regulator [Paracoccaceae bacterium]
MTKKKPHHHGNLRAALLEAGLELLHDGGLENLSMRKLASKAGVSHAAPAHHFANQTALHSGLMTEGYKMFTVAMQSEIKLAPNDPREIILAAGRGYLTFTQENEGLFNLMFGGTPRDHDDAELNKASEEAYNVLREICVPIVKGEGGSEANELMIWSLIHGLARLVLHSKRDTINAEKSFETWRLILPPLEFAT